MSSKTPRQAESFQPRKKAKTARLQVTTGPSSDSLAPRAAASPELNEEQAEPCSLSDMSTTTTEPNSPSLSQSLSEAGPQQYPTTQQVIKSTWTFVNRWLHDNPDHENPILNILLKLLRAVDFEDESNQDLMMARMNSLVEHFVGVKDALSALKKDIAPLAVTGQQDTQTQLDDKVTGIQHDVAILQQLMQGMLAASNENAISAGTKVGDIQSRMATSASIEANHATTEQKLVNMGRHIQLMMSSIERLETLMVKSYQKSKTQDNVMNKIIRKLDKQHITVRSYALETKKQLAAIADVGTKLPRMASHVETIKWCVRRIAQKLDVPDVQVVLANNSPAVVGQQAAVAHTGQVLQNVGQPPANAASGPPVVVNPPSSPSPPASVRRGTITPIVKQRRSVSARYRASRGNALQASGVMDYYLLKGSK